MKRVLPGILCGLLLALSGMLSGQGASFTIGYGISKFVFRPANLDIARYNLDQGKSSPMDFPDYLRGFSFGSRQFFGDHFTGEFHFSQRQMRGKNTATDTLGESHTYELKCGFTSFSFGGAAGLRLVKVGLSFDAGFFRVASRFNNGSWEPTFEKQRKLWFSHTYYLSILLPFMDVAMLEIRPYWQVSWFSVRMGSSQPLMAFRPSNYGLTIYIGFGRIN